MTEPLTTLAAKLRRVEAAALTLEDRGSELEAKAAVAASLRIQRRMADTRPVSIAGVAILLELAAEHVVGVELKELTPEDMGERFIVAALQGAKALAEARRE